MEKRTKIVATIGPSSESIETLTAMVDAGVNVARLNFSHGTYENHAELIKRIREASKKTNKVVAIMQDLQGPKIRVGELPKEGIELKKDTTVVFDTGAEEYSDGIIPVGYKDLHKHLKIGDRLLLNDGRVETIIEQIDGTRIVVQVKNGGVITSHKGINIPDSGLTISALSEKDKEDAIFGIAQHVDFIALSFVTSEKDIEELRSLIKAHDTQSTPIKIIAKMERAAALKNMDEIIEAADGIMVARGDLGIEIPAAQVPPIQKTLIAKALAAAKPVIVATQMLDSMQDNPRPTRAEVSDVANAVIDHTDAVMLSNETASGSYPLEAVVAMRDIIIETERSGYDDMPISQKPMNTKDVVDAIVSTARILSEEVGASLIIAGSITGTTARLISHHRPELPVIVATPSPRVKAQMNLLWGVYPFEVPNCSSVIELMDHCVSFVKEKGLAAVGDTVIAVEGGSVGTPGDIKKLEVVVVS